MHIRDLYSLQGKCAVVIGGAGKIGLPISEALAEAGANVCVASKSKERCDDAAGRLKAQGLIAEGFAMDQSDEASVVSCLQEVTKKFKTPDILVNCAVERPMKKFFDDTVENWDRSMAVNARGLFITCRAFARAMKEKGGSIINVSSIYGLVAPDQNVYQRTDLQTEPDYPYHKGGMIMFSKYLASLLAKDGIRVNCIAPGGLFNNQSERFVEQYTKKVPLGRMAEADDIKGVVVFLASDASRYISGAVIPVDGGFTIT
ncbi:MAG: SDR family oxidoreductase [Parcubacteria group bacterium]|nr:SDR family oxidoreductase [Parcubacteria group bacterium]